jgi:rare lipoprotein A
MTLSTDRGALQKAAKVLRSEAYVQAYSFRGLERTALNVRRGSCHRANLWCELVGAIPPQHIPPSFTRPGVNPSQRDEPAIEEEARPRAGAVSKRTREADSQGDGTATQGKKTASAKRTRSDRLGTVRATWYQHRGRTATGEKFNPEGRTAAHKTLPLGTRLRVVNRQTGRSVIVRVNDRVPRTAKHPVDLSRGSARALGIADAGVASVALHELR